MPEVAVVARDEPGHFDRAGVIERLGGDEGTVSFRGSHVCTGQSWLPGGNRICCQGADVDVLAREALPSGIAVDLLLRCLGHAGA